MEFSINKSLWMLSLDRSEELQGWPDNTCLVVVNFIEVILSKAVKGILPNKAKALFGVSLRPMGVGWFFGLKQKWNPHTTSIRMQPWKWEPPYAFKVEGIPYSEIVTQMMEKPRSQVEVVRSSNRKPPPSPGWSTKPGSPGRSWTQGPVPAELKSWERRWSCCRATWSGARGRDTLVSCFHLLSCLQQAPLFGWTQLETNESLQHTTSRGELPTTLPMTQVKWGNNKEWAKANRPRIGTI